MQVLLQILTPPKYFAVFSMKTLSNRKNKERFIISVKIRIWKFMFKEKKQCCDVAISALYQKIKLAGSLKILERLISHHLSVGLSIHSHTPSQEYREQVLSISVKKHRYGSRNHLTDIVKKNLIQKKMKYFKANNNFICPTLQQDGDRLQARTGNVSCTHFRWPVTNDSMCACIYYYSSAAVK